MGSEWLTGQEFHQIREVGEAGLTTGKVVILASPAPPNSGDEGHRGGGGHPALRGEMEEVAPVHGFEASSEELARTAWPATGTKPNLRRIGSDGGTLALSVDGDDGAGRLISKRTGSPPFSLAWSWRPLHRHGTARANPGLVEAGGPLEILSELECTEPCRKSAGERRK